MTEVCQYYAFWFDCISVEEYSDLYKELMERLGENRKEGYLPQMGKPNVMYGLYMRIDLLMREGKRKEVYEECIRLFEKMANRTGTLWEHNGIGASCIHGFAAYAAKWLIYALTGYDCICETFDKTNGVGVDCEVIFPKNVKYGGKLKISVKGDRVFVDII